ncbi:MAG: EAL domain-containing protein [Nitrospirae bacterium]|nr:EAL domain-containing protein [Nitrospirota bacterium]
MNKYDDLISEKPIADWQILIISDDSQLAQDLQKRLDGLNCKGIKTADSCDEIMAVTLKERNLLILIREPLALETKCRDVIRTISDTLEIPLLLIIESDDHIGTYYEPHTCLRLYNLEDDLFLYEAIESAIIAHVLKKRVNASDAVFLALFKAIPDMVYSVINEPVNQFYDAVEQGASIIIALSIDGNIKYINKIFEEVTGFDRYDFYGKHVLSLLPLEESLVFKNDGLLLIKKGEIYRGQFGLISQTGSKIPTFAVISPLRDINNGIQGFIIIVDLNIPSSTDYLDDYTYDKTTGLLRRNKFIELIDIWIKDQEGQNNFAALIQIDIDGFKFINNTLGHITADNFLRHITESIKGIIGSDEFNTVDVIIGRFGEDELSLFLCSNEFDAVKLAEKIRKRVEISQFKDAPFHATVSIGIAYYPQHGVDSKELIMKANAALLHAKESGKNNCHVFDESHEFLNKIHLTINIKENILKALAQDRFEPWFQPQLDLKTNTIDHYEALARMRDIDGSIILPYAFIKTAESNSLVGYIDRVIIEKTMFRQAEIADHYRHVSFSVNLSAKNIGDVQLLEYLKFKIAETKIDPKRLIFEITETEAILDLESAIDFISQLRSLGCQFALDDFGVGFTSFVYLRKMNVDIIKIDGSFIVNLDKNKGDRLIVKAMVDMAKGMGIKTVAEFVENEASLQILRELGVDFAQGYLIGKPSPVLVSKFTI